MDFEFTQRQVRTTAPTISSNLTFQLLALGLVLTQFSFFLHFIIIIPLITAYLFLPLILMYWMFFGPNRLDDTSPSINHRAIDGYELISYCEESDLENASQVHLTQTWKPGILRHKTLRYQDSPFVKLEHPSLLFIRHVVLLRWDTLEINLAKTVLIVCVCNQAHRPWLR